MDIPKRAEQMRAMVNSLYDPATYTRSNIWKEIASRRTFINDDPDNPYYGEIHHVFYHVFIYRQRTPYDTQDFYVHICRPTNPNIFDSAVVTVPDTIEPLNEIVNHVRRRTQ